MCPASTKNGTARSGKLCDAEATCWTPIDIGIGPVAKTENPARPIAKATGIPSAISTKKGTASRVKERPPRCGHRDRRRGTAAAGSSGRATPPAPEEPGGGREGRRDRRGAGQGKRGGG